MEWVSYACIAVGMLLIAALIARLMDQLERNTGDRHGGGINEAKYY